VLRLNTDIPMQPIETFGLDHVDLTVAELDRSARFYSLVLGAFGFRRLDERTWANRHLSLSIHRSSGQERDTLFDPRRTGLHHLAFRAGSRGAVDAFYRFLLEHNIVILDPPNEYPQYGRNYYAVFFADPDRMKIELVHFPWGYWRRVSEIGHDERPRFVEPGTVQQDEGGSQ